MVMAAVIMVGSNHGREGAKWHKFEEASLSYDGSVNERFDSKNWLLYRRCHTLYELGYNGTVSIRV